MEKMRIRCLKVADDEQGSDALLKHEVERMTEYTHGPDLANQQLQIHLERSRSIKTEEDAFHTDAKANAVYEFTPVAQTDEYLKTELMLDEELTNIRDDAEANSKQDVLANHQCGICSRYFQNKRMLTEHLRIHSKDSRQEFACDLCERTFYYKCSLKRHKKIHTGDGYPCKVCGQRFVEKGNLKAHMVRRQHFDKPQQFTPQKSNNYVASLKTERTSDKEFINEGNVIESVSHAEETQSSALAGDDEQQRGIDTDMDSVTCEVCHNIIPRELIKAHMRLKHNDATYKCQFCSRSFKTKWYLKAHLPTHSKERRREFACDLCGKTFYEKNTLNNHKKIHTGDGHPCKVCGQRFTEKANLKKHLVRRQHFDKPHQFTAQSSNNDVASMKINVIPDEKFIAEGNGSESISYAEGTQQPALAGDKQLSGVDTVVGSVTCEVCHNSYPEELIRVHIRLTHNNKAYECPLCSRSYTTKFSLTKHLHTHSKDRRREFACDLCDKAFYEKKYLNMHKKIHNGYGYPCKVCGNRFTSKSNLKAHMIRSQHFDKIQQFTFQGLNNDSASMKTERMSDEEFLDEGNGRESPSLVQGTQHPALAGDNKQQTGAEATVDSVACEVCHNSYPGELIKAHMRFTHYKKAYECQFCSRSYTTKFCLMKHLRLHSKNKKREFACDLCGKTFYEKSNLNSHKKIHTGDGYPCKACGQRFTQKRNLKAHMVRRQHFDKPQQFTPQSSNNDVAFMKTELMSDEEFIDEGNGNESVSHAEETQPPALAGDDEQQPAVDTPVDSVTCEVCHNSYRGELIKAHMRLTHNDETYKCQFCSQFFKTKGDLKVHRRMHSKDRRRGFACDFCEKAFYCKKSLASHKKIHAGDRYPCKVCGYRFTRKEDLKTHMVRRQHFDKPQQFTSQSSNNDVPALKSELISDEEFIDEGSGTESASHAEGTQQPTLTGDNNQLSGVDTVGGSATCEVCHNSYPGELIKAHMRLTHNKKTYECQFCSRSYTTKFSLTKHLRTHSKDRRRKFACDLCDKAFYEKKYLNMHKKIHTGYGYRCKVCENRFTTKSNLKAHMVRSQHFDKTQQFPLQSPNNDVASMKTEEISDEEFIDEGNGS